MEFSLFFGADIFGWEERGACALRLRDKAKRQDPASLHLVFRFTSTTLSPPRKARTTAPPRACKGDSVALPLIPPPPAALAFEPEITTIVIVIIIMMWASSVINNE